MFINDRKVRSVFVDGLANLMLLKVVRHQDGTVEVITLILPCC